MGSEGSETSELEKYKKLFEESERSRQKLDDALKQETLLRKEEESQSFWRKFS